MFDYLEDVIVECLDDLKGGTLIYPVNDNLFRVNEDSLQLTNNHLDLFHRVTARLLFAAKRAQPDLQVCVVFLCTCVKDAREEDYSKLARMIKYLKETIHLPLIVGADENGIMVWNINTSFAVHPDCKSHTGAVLMLGRGSMLSMSCKQKINTKSSTEEELVGVDDALTFAMWMKHFFKSQVEQTNQGSKLKNLGKEIIIEQDNTSATQLKKNGWKSSSKCTKHINVRYFCITDKLKNGNTTQVVYEPTENMTSD